MIASRPTVMDIACLVDSILYFIMSLFVWFLSFFFTDTGYSLCSICQPLTWDCFWPQVSAYFFLLFSQPTSDIVA